MKINDLTLAKNTDSWYKFLRESDRELFEFSISIAHSKKIGTNIEDSLKIIRGITGVTTVKIVDGSASEDKNQNYFICNIKFFPINPSLPKKTLKDILSQTRKIPGITSIIFKNDLKSIQKI
jgi:hypothetical protein